jgi:hypothetical protein
MPSPEELARESVWNSLRGTIVDIELNIAVRAQ